MYRKDLRPEIVDSFIAEFNEFGPKLTLDRVSSRIHISKKTIYRFFRSKDEIYSYILKQAARDVAMGQKAVLEDSSLSPAEKVRRILPVPLGKETGQPGNTAPPACGWYLFPLPRL